MEEGGKKIKKRCGMKLKKKSCKLRFTDDLHARKYITERRRKETKRRRRI